jgi:hypothetical protein
MAITEQDRHLIYQRLEEVIGSEAAGKLMEHLPPTGWGDVATKRDLDHLSELNGAEFRRVDEKIDGLAGRLDEKIDGVAARLEAKFDNLERTFEARLQQQTTRLVAILVPAIGLMLAGFRFV